jgi:hypothetical protein
VDPRWAFHKYEAFLTTVTIESSDLNSVYSDGATGSGIGSEAAGAGASSEGEFDSSWKYDCVYAYDCQAPTDGLPLNTAGDAGAASGAALNGADAAAAEPNETTAAATGAYTSVILDTQAWALASSMAQHQQYQAMFEGFAGHAFEW